MNYSHTLSAAALIVTLLLSAACMRKQNNAPPTSDYIPMNKDSLKSSAKLYLVPLGEFPYEVAEELASFYRSKYGIHVETLPNVPISPGAMNRRRRQLIAEGAVEILEEAYPQLKNNSEAIVIGLTIKDMYIAQVDWQFGFSWRAQNKYAVVSVGRMNLPNGKQKVTKELFLSRIRKVVTKNVGILYYKLGASDNPRSVLYRKVGGIRELDNMGEDF
jgi:predicted Zn-dependent protease